MKSSFTSRITPNFSKPNASLLDGHKINPCERSTRILTKNINKIKYYDLLFYFVLVLIEKKTKQQFNIYFIYRLSLIFLANFFIILHPKLIHYQKQIPLNNNNKNVNKKIIIQIL